VEPNSIISRVSAEGAIRGAGALNGASGQLGADVAGGAGGDRSGEQNQPAGGEDASGAQQVGQATAEQA